MVKWFKAVSWLGGLSSQSNVEIKDYFVAHVDDLKHYIVQLLLRAELTHASWMHSITSIKAYMNLAFNEKSASDTASFNHMTTVPKYFANFGAKQKVLVVIPK